MITGDHHNIAIETGKSAAPTVGISGRPRPNERMEGETKEIPSAGICPTIVSEPGNYEVGLTFILFSNWRDFARPLVRETAPNTHNHSLSSPARSSAGVKPPKFESRRSPPKLVLGLRRSSELKISKI